MARKEIMVTKFRTRLSHPYIEDFKKKKSIEFTEPSLTEQSFSYETDINNIVKRGVQSSLPPNQNRPIFNSSFSPNQYNEAINLIADAKSQFESLPSHLRKRFDNNPEKLLEFVSNDKNREEAISLGFIEKPIETIQPVIKNPTEVIVGPAPSTNAEASSQ